MSKEKRDEDKSVFDLIEGLTRVDSERTRRFYANDDARGHSGNCQGGV